MRMDLEDFIVGCLRDRRCMLCSRSSQGGFRYLASSAVVKLAEEARLATLRSARESLDRQGKGRVVSYDKLAVDARDGGSQDQELLEFSAEASRLSPLLLSSCVAAHILSLKAFECLVNESEADHTQMTPSQLIAATEELSHLVLQLALKVKTLRNKNSYPSLAEA